MRSRLSLIRFVGDICISAAIVAVVFWVEWRFVSANTLFFIWLIIVPVVLLPIAGLFAAPFIAVLTFGAIKQRFGFVLGPILAAGIAFGLQSLAIKREDDVFAQKRAVIVKMTSATVDPVRGDHMLLAVDDAFNGNGNLCDETCIKVLVASNHTVAFKSDLRGDHTWKLYTRIEGPACYSKENAGLALKFLLRGFPGKCATQTSVADFEDGLFLRTTRSANPAFQLTPGMPEGFTGTMSESYERIDGRDRLLERHIEGAFESALSRFPLWKKLPGVSAGAPIDRTSYLANAIGSDVDSLRKPATPFPFEDVLSGIEKYFDQKEAIDADTFRSAKLAWLQIIANSSEPQAQLRKESVLRLLASHDPFRTELGIEAISFMNLDERVFPDDVMLDLVFVPMSKEATASMLEKQFERQYSPGRTPPTDDVLERARAHLNDPNIKPWQSHVLNLMINQLN